MPDSPFSRTILNIGFVAALALAAAAFGLAAYYLQSYGDSTQAVVARLMEAGYSDKQLTTANLELLQNGLGVHTYVARVLLVSCGLFIALAFGFLGFALFLVGASGQSEVRGETPASLRLTITNLAPGTITILAAALLAGICATRPLPLDLAFGDSEDRGGTNLQQPATGPDADVNRALTKPEPKAP